MVGKILRKKVLRREWKTPRGRSATGLGSEYDEGKEYVMMKDRLN